MSDEMKFNDPFTADGRFKPGPSVTRAKVSAVKELVEQAMHGDKIAKGKLEESLTTSDALFSYAYLTTINLLPQFQRATRKWSLIAGQRTVQDFRKPVLYSLVQNWNQPGVLNNGSASGQYNGAAPVVPELNAYPEVHFQGEEAIAGGLAKRGVRTTWSFESWINDALGVLEAIPSELLRIALDTEEYAVFSTLTSGVSGSTALQADTTPSGATVPINSSLSREALIAAIKQVKLRLINGRYVEVDGGFNLLVGVGQGIYANYILNQQYLGYNEGTGNFPKLNFDITGYDPLAGITVIESPFITAPAWILLPKPGTTERPVIDLLRLAGHENPELRVENAQGSYIGGASVSPFEGSFIQDATTLRLRHIVGAALWTPQLMVSSTGLNA